VRFRTRLFPGAIYLLRIGGDETAKAKGDTTMLTKTKLAVLATALILGSASAALAQAVVPEYDGDANRIPGRYIVVPSTASAIEHSFAGPVTTETTQYPSYGANGPAWQRHFDNWLSSVD
jgi:hypothetical protein